MRFSSISVVWRIIMAMAVPLLGLVVFSLSFILSQLDTAKDMYSVKVATTFSGEISAVVHQLQRERGRSAGFIGSSGDAQYRALMEAQRAETDQAWGSYNASKAYLRGVIDDPHLYELLNELQGNLDQLDAHRTQIDGGALSLGDAVAPYTATITLMLEMVAELSKIGNSSEIAGMKIALLNIMTAKENAGIERAIGTNVFASGAITPVLHQRASNLIARQDAYMVEFAELMGPDWAERIEAFQNTSEAQAVAQAREVLIGAGYGGELTGYTGTDWFDLTSSRIELMMTLEREIFETVAAMAEDARAQARSQANWAIVISICGFIFTALFTGFLIYTVVAPLSQITHALKKLSDGETEIEIKGGDRGDEIGVLARTAEAFSKATQERETAVRERIESEKEAMTERRRVMADMASSVQEATTSSVGAVSDTATSLAENSQTMSNTLESAGATAKEVNEATAATLERTNRAAELASELSSAIAEVTEQITRGDALAREAVAQAQDSRQNVEELNESAQQISDFIGLINDLAEQTNLLALNATIEAARAGEAGKGFAVVASEVKALAAQTNKSTTEIAERVNHIQSRTQTTVETMASITEAINKIGEVTAAVAAAMEEQRASTGSFSDFVEENRDALAKVGETINTLADLAASSAKDAETMAATVQTMTQAANEANTAIPKIVQKAVEKAERRNHDRTEIKDQVTLIVDGEEHPVRLKDYSASGIQIESRTVLTTGQDVAVKHSLINEKGAVAWVEGTLAGIQFRRLINVDTLNKLERFKDSQAA